LKSKGKLAPIDPWNNIWAKTHVIIKVRIVIIFVRKELCQAHGRISGMAGKVIFLDKGWRYLSYGNLLIYIFVIV
jgi:hypothetical protein